MRFIVKDNSHDLIMAVIVNNKTHDSFNGDVQNNDCQPIQPWTAMSVGCYQIRASGLIQPGKATTIHQRLCWGQLHASNQMVVVMRRQWSKFSLDILLPN